jgi:Fusaric acid resistance protein-like
MVTKSIQTIAFIQRRSGAATVGYELASPLGLHEVLWAAILAAIVSQELLHETRSTLVDRIFGTLLGIGVTVGVSEAASPIAATTAVQTAVATWSCPLILPTAQPSTPIVLLALRRGSEVFLGAIVGWIFHWGSEVVADVLAKRSLSLRQHHASRHMHGRSRARDRNQHHQAEQP